MPIPTPPTAADTLPALGVVVIGRNEGERLRVCLQSALRLTPRVIYVDSGSSDGSPEMARGLGAQVHVLDASKPFTAARGRNMGWQLLAQAHPQVQWVQFIDGDCELQPQWLSKAVAFLESHADAVAACGRLRERHPQASIYNMLCDHEWNTPVGQTKACGGIAMMRLSAVQAVKGFREDLIAGEEPELCVRLRQAGGTIWRLDEEMALHDVAMTRFGQWWKRARRGGYAFAQGHYIHGAPPERHWAQETRSMVVWGVALPVLAAAGALLLRSPWPLALALLYPLQALRVQAKLQGPRPERVTRAGFLVLAKLPEGLGWMNFWFDQLTGRRPTIIEYK